jgi:uncharacterized protein (TIGR03067 family)
MTPALLALALVAAAPAPKDKASIKNGPALVGEWVVKKAEAAGMRRPVPVGGMTMEFKADGKPVVKQGAKPPEDGSYAAEARKGPAEVDLTPPATGGKAVTTAGIYKVKRDTLALCPAAVGARPTESAAAAGPTPGLMTLKRPE